MAAQAQRLARSVDVHDRFFAFLRSELTPRRSMWPVLMRVVLTIVLTFLIVSTFRMPYAAITLYSVFTVDRSSRRAALLRALESTVAITLGVAVGLLGVMLFADFPLLNFLYYAVELFIAAFLIRTTRLQGPAMNLSMAVYSVHNAWERPYPAGPHIEQTLWVWLTLCLGFFISVLVEFAFAKDNALGQMYSELAGRMRALSELFAAIGGDDGRWQVLHNAVLDYAYAGTSAIRQRVVSLRNTEPGLGDELLRLNTVTSLIARLIDVSATLEPAGALDPSERQRAQSLARELDRLAALFESHQHVAQTDYQPPATPSPHLPSLPELERTARMIPTAISASRPEAGEPPLDVLDPQSRRASIFVPDAFSNPGYLLFALKTMVAAMLCYVVYSGCNWPGISTSVVTCLVTALNTVGATKQKQILRLTGATAGGVIALASIVFLVPEIDSVTSMTVLIAAVSTFSAWFALASPRLSYFGLQTALAFYLAMFQNYQATTELSPARDRAMGVLLGLGMMWLVFDNLWPVSALEHMRSGLARNLRLVAEVVTTPDRMDRTAAIRTIRNLRDRIQGGFVAVHGHADSVLFEIGAPNRQHQLAMRHKILSIQATLRTFFMVEIAVCQYLTQLLPITRPAKLKEAQARFHRELALVLLETANAVEQDRPPVITNTTEVPRQQLEEIANEWMQATQDPWIITRLAGITALRRQSTTLALQLAEIAGKEQLIA